MKTITLILFLLTSGLSFSQDTLNKFIGTYKYSWTDAKSHEHTLTFIMKADLSFESRCEGYSCNGGMIDYGTYQYEKETLILNFQYRIYKDKPDKKVTFESQGYQTEKKYVLKEGQLCRVPNADPSKPNVCYIKQ